VTEGEDERGVGGAGDVGSGGADVERPAEARAWVRARAEAAGCPAAVVDELVLLVSEVLVADADRSGGAGGPRRLRAVPSGGGLSVEVLLPVPLLPLPDRDGRLALAVAATHTAGLDARPASAGGQWVRIHTRA
jgi:hypothetical protein